METIIRMAREVLEVENVIGKGGFGVILTVGNEEKRVIKINHSAITCKELDFEYQLQLSAYEAFNKYTTYREKMRIGGIPQPHSFDVFGNNSAHCYMTMDRVFPPKSSNSKETQIWQLWLGDERNLFVRDPDRGVFTGINSLEKLDMDINKISSDMAVIAAILHYGSKQTAIDVEYVIGRKYDELDREENKVFAFDFNQSTFWDKEVPIDMLVQSLEMPAVAPDSTEAPELWNTFREVYIRKATEIGYKEASILVMDTLEQRQKY